MLLTTKGGDCDDCCYQNEWRTAAKITDAIAGYTARLGLSKERAYALYKAHGTCLKGMLVEGVIAEANVEELTTELILRRRQLASVPHPAAGAFTSGEDFGRVIGNIMQDVAKI